MFDLKYKYKNLLEDVKKLFQVKIDSALILGSGLGDFAKSINCSISIKNSSIKEYPISTVPGHEGYIHFVEYHNKNILIFQGRVHFYEGYELHKCLIPLLIAETLGCKNLILTNSAGCINKKFQPGDLLLLTDFNSFNIKRELSQIVDYKNSCTPNIKLNLPSKELNQKIRQAAEESQQILQEGSYWYTTGPSYETPAEIKMMSNFGYDAVGMSTVYEAIYAASLGMNVCAISCLTNYAAGISNYKLSHQEVIETADRVKTKFEKLLKTIIRKL